MQAISVARAPLAPDLGILPERAVARTRDIGEDTVKPEFLIVADLEVRVEGYASALLLTEECLVRADESAEWNDRDIHASQFVTISPLEGIRPVWWTSMCVRL